LTVTRAKEMEERNREVCLYQTVLFSNAEHLVAGYWLFNNKKVAQSNACGFRMIFV
jgi:hypothetical protein